MVIRFLKALPVAILFLMACHSSQKMSLKQDESQKPEEKKNPVSAPYRSSNTLTNDLLHTRLVVRFDWIKQQLFGQATLTLTPYFYPTSLLFLNARGMELKEISLVTKKGKINLNYSYSNDSIAIVLDRVYQKGETYVVFIDYVAKPEELKIGGSTAITSDKGLYFINPDGLDPDKPRQIWTQGETQSNSVWFPTIDSPNERMTQEIYITIDTAYTTLSNGLLISSLTNADGTKTDYWKQSLPAAPYLTMMAIGKYSVVKDTWRSKEVNYYVEPEYEPYARLIFGNTPEMLEFFSTRLGVEYPWEKFSQVVVRDYVSGAMENTTAVVHGEFVQQTAREMLDASYEDYIAHELFHQWFGDLVTCESWSNIPLNESFATYGSCLWYEYKYGRDAADYELQRDLSDYMMIGRSRNLDLIRYNYENREELFDVVSYQKGGRVLHMLRKIVGDDAFFASLRLYLNSNKFRSVESSQLRLAFEEVTGQDLNWFFNEWFYNGGHPELKITYSYIDTLKRQYLMVEQTQDLEHAPLYRIPVDVDLYYNDTVIRKKITLSQLKDTFLFDVPVKPDLVNFDAEKMLLAIKNDQHEIDEWVFMFHHAPLYLDRYESLAKLSKNYKATGKHSQVIMEALKDVFWNIRLYAIKAIEPLTVSDKSREETKKILITLSETDPRSDVRVAALKALAKYYIKDHVSDVFKKAAADSSYDVMGEAIYNYIESEGDSGLQWLQQFEKTDNRHLDGVIAGIYADKGSDINNEFFVQVLNKSRGFSKNQLVSDYSRFLARCRAETIAIGYPVIAGVAAGPSVWWVRLSAMHALEDLIKACDEKSEALSEEMIEDSKNGKSSIEIHRLENEKKGYEELIKEIRQKILEIKKNETDRNLIGIYHGRGE